MRPQLCTTLRPRCSRALMRFKSDSWRTLVFPLAQRYSSTIRRHYPCGETSPCLVSCTKRRGEPAQNPYRICFHYVCPLSTPWASLAEGGMDGKLLTLSGPATLSPYRALSMACLRFSSGCQLKRAKQTRSKASKQDCSLVRRPQHDKPCAIGKRCFTLINTVH